jgi:Nif-specific regulatory protein
MERAVLTAKDDFIRGYNLPESINKGGFDEDVGQASSMTLDEQIVAFEKRVLQDALNRHDGNSSAAGRELGVSPRMMNYRLKKVGIK